MNPDNPTGTIVRRRAMDDYFRHVPDHVLTIVDEAYFEYVTDPEYPNALEYLRRGSASPCCAPSPRSTRWPGSASATASSRRTWRRSCTASGCRST